MAEQLHRIKRQILELSIPGKEATPSFYAELRRIYDRSIAPLIETCFSEFARPDQIYRIDRLQLDLGVLDANNLEADLVSKIAVQLRQQLSKQLQSEKTSTETEPEEDTPDEAAQKRRHKKPTAPHSQVELLLSFCRMGTLPWWAEASNPRLLDATIQNLLQKSPDVLIQLLGVLSRETRPLKRIVRHFDESTLLELCLLAQPALATGFDAVREIFVVGFARRGLKIGFTETAFRHLLWEILFQLSYALQGQKPQPHIFWRDLLSRLAGHFACSKTTLVVELSHLCALNTPPIDPAVLRLFEPIFLENKQMMGLKAGLQKDKKVEPALVSLSDDFESLFDQDTSSVSNSASFESVLLKLKQSGETFEPLFAPLRHVFYTLSPALRASFLSALQGLDLKKVGLPTEDRKIKEKLRQLLIEGVPQNGPARIQRKACLLALADRQPHHDLGGSELKEIYVDNAGLVILWPFLIQFFKHMDLMDKAGFKDRASLHRAVLLLQYLVTEQDAPVEYQLTLNRVLCGMDLDTVFEQDTPVSEEEKQACQALLEAVIAQVPILKKMSPRGFRGTFLIRKGVLSTRDGLWFLRVSRNDFDVVLDHFPWSVGWVKLSCMSHALEVEW